MRKFKLNHGSISTKFFTVLLLVLFVGQGVGTFLFISYTRSSLMDGLNHRMERLVRHSANFLATPLMNYDYQFLDTFLDETLDDKDILSLRIVDSKGKVIKERNRQSAEAERFSASHVIRFGREKLGQLQVEFAPVSVAEGMSQSLFVIPLYQLAMFASVALIFSLMFQFYIRRPLRKITKVIGEVTSGDLTVTVPKLSKDEIGDIADGIRFLVEGLAGTINRLSAIIHNVNSAMEQLNQTFDKVIDMVDNQQGAMEQVSGAVKAASESHRTVNDRTEELLGLSNDNVSALLEMRATTEEVASGTEKQSTGVNNSYSTVTELSQSARQVAVMANEVTTAIEESSASVEEIFSSLKEVEKVVRDSAALSNQTSDIISKKGIGAVTNAAESMKGIESFILGLTAAIDGLGERSQTIGKVLAVISEVTEQIQLLSLNAQIIAAQAGEHGRSFAVVANEMKDLSDKTATSTREIDEIVSSIQGEIMEVVEGGRNAVGVINESNRVVGQTGEVFEEIQSSAEKSTEMASRIERATLEQTKGLELIVSAIEQIKSRIFEVSKATEEQEKSTAYLVKNITPIKENMDMIKRATEEQARSARLISDNIEQANRKTSDITVASSEQQEVHRQIIGATEDVVQLAEETAMDIKGVAAFINTLTDELGVLKETIEQYRVSGD